MAQLEPQQQNFVETLIEYGAGPKKVEPAAVAAGYAPKYGWQLMKKPHVLAAIREEAAKGLLSGALLGMQVLMEIASDTTHKDRLKAAKELLAHSGFVAEQKIIVENKTDGEARQLITEIREFCRVTGLDATQLLGSIGVRPALPAPVEAIDAEFEEVWSVD